MKNIKITKYYKEINGVNTPFYECCFVIHAFGKKGKNSMTDNDFKGEGCLQILDTITFSGKWWF